MGGRADTKIKVEEDEAEEFSAPDYYIDQTASIKYWNSISPDVNSMLRSPPHISRNNLSRIDLRGSANFLAKLRRWPSSGPPQTKLPVAVDCGAGIGRVTEGFLTRACQVVDVVEPVSKFADVVKEKKEAQLIKTDGKAQIGDIFVTGLESWYPTKKYDLIWNQWCLDYLTDSQVVEYLKRCGNALREGGWIAVKENLSTDQFGEDIYNDIDSSVTRSDLKFLDLFEEAGLQLVRGELHTSLRYPVKMYAVRPK